MQNNEVTEDQPEPSKRIRAAEYVRMSTEHQQYSTENQADKIREYARVQGIEIVRTYADDGKSGLNIGGRKSLQQLLGDVDAGAIDFKLVLVYDVSRWGRFQDPDEAAYYEHLLKRKGVHVRYVAEQFDNDGSPVSTIVKGVKRAMAGEYSRELSVKVFAGQCRLIELGYRQGGPAGYGLRRVLLDQTGSVKAELARGEHKSLQTDRVILMPGPDVEVQNVLQIYRWFTEDGLSESEIATRLNEQGVRTDLGFNRVSFKLKMLRTVNQPDKWVRKEGAFAAIVPPETFYVAQGIIRGRTHRYSMEELIEKLRNLYEHRGYLSGLIIDETEGMPSSSAYIHKFGSLIRAYQTVGFTPDRDYRYLEVNQFLRRLHPQIVAQTEQAIGELGGTIERDPATDLLLINREFTVSLVLARCQTHDNGRNRWKVRFDTSLEPDITVAVRLNHANDAPMDYYLLPRLDFGQPRISLADRNAIEIESYRFDTLEYFYGMAQRTRLRRAA